ncbi:preprotein translocase subunit SecA [Candidatus Finniella inopinata]|uniref:Protein translocase subunit SecA n=1 Tax=Candidatus Finniella inopinata TaxID=1696036 RepID=A0A4Q7DMX1_9PROT|nr:preprotein translocase subunit SecA [Candidatus Finniella inopinata]RZI46186.1 preprotein translocase subunit SecA [Candidatus Finniella inopinata]
MLASVLKKVFGSANDRIVKKYDKIAKQIGLLESSVINLTDQELQDRTRVFKERVANGETLDSLMPEAFATVREAAKRVLGMRPFDVQLVGGMVLHNGTIAEMKTGEGKTLMATLPVYLNALSGKGVHLVTVNDYLAQRDAAWMGKIYEFLGLTVGCVVHGLSDDQRRRAYGADVTYGTNHEFGFDYLRDNMKFRLGEMVMRPFNYAIVDEVDSILIDEARTPLIISGPAEDSSDLYQKIDELIPTLIETDYEKDEKQRSVTLTEAGVEKLEQLLFQKNLIKGNGLYDVQNMSVVHHVNSALRAHKLYSRDVDYIVKNDQVIIIDEFTGRMMEGRRFSEGLHQALEAKEKVTVEMENQTLASITYQNFFRLYPKLSGMAGTAVTEADEFEEIYNLQAIEIPPNVRVARLDHDDEVYLTAREKYAAVIEQIKDCQGRKQPVLVGTTSIERSEFLSGLLKEHKIPHQVLNARYHDQEALIIADAGCSGAVTIATNMAGRGTDIKLGGNLEMRVERELKDMPWGPERDQRIAAIKAEIDMDEERVKKAGGLYVIGTERHESRRIDNQLRGRSGRQGDPGGSKFFISLEDDLMRIFGSERLDPMLRKLGVKENEAISHTWITKALERAQHKVEARNFDIRKHLLKYDDVMNDQRKIIYEQRRDLMKLDSIEEMTKAITDEVIAETVQFHAPAEVLPDQWDLKGFHAEITRLFGLDLPLQSWIDEETVNPAEIEKRIHQKLKEKMDAKVEAYGPEMMRSAEKTLLLRILDQSWKDHLLSLDHLRQGINLRAYAQSNPLNEYKREAFNLFQYMMAKLKSDFVVVLSHFDLKLSDNTSLDSILEPSINFDALEEMTPEDWAGGGSSPEEAAVQRLPRKTRNVADIDSQNPDTWGRIQRNAACPCGSDKKYKHCHGIIGG